MSRHRVWRAAALVAGIAATGCTSLREVPRPEYTAEPERKHVRIVTRDGLVYEFDRVAVSGDTLIGFRRQDVESNFDEFSSMRFLADEVTQFSARRLDWKRTGLIGGGVIAVLVARGLSESDDEDPGSSEGGGGPGGRVP